MRVRLNRDENLYGVTIDSGGFDLNGHKLTIGKGGFHIFSNSGYPQIVGAGSITSSADNLNFYFKNKGNQTGYVIESKLADHASHKVGLVISGGVPGYESHLDLTGGEDNKFTGDVHISGHSGLQLYKRNGKTAIHGNIFVNDNGYLFLSGSNQIDNTSTITLNGNGGRAALMFPRIYNSEISEAIHALVVKGSAVIDFDHYADIPHGMRALYLDDLDISWGSELAVENWALGRDYLLVRKDSAHLKESLDRIKFKNTPAGWHGGLKEYNKDYWQIIPDLPEPATYGALFGAVGLGLSFWRNRGARQRRRAAQRGRLRLAA